MRFRRRVVPVLGAVIVGLAGAWLAMLAVGRFEYRLGPLDVEYFARPGAPGTELVLPPFGRILAETHASPLRITATLESVEPARLQRAIRGRALGVIAAAVQEDAVSALRSYLLAVAGIATLGALVAGVAVYRRQLRRVATAAAAGALATALVIGLAGITFRPSAFREPTYTGSLRLAATLVGPIREAGAQLEEFRSELDRIVAASLEAYSGIAEQPTPTPGGIRVLRISDIHGSPIGMDFALRLARAFDVDLVIDTGDITSFGTPPERAVLTRIPEFGVPYVFVRGNHDSVANARSIVGAPNAVVLEDEAREVAGLRIYGAPHPLYTPDPSFDLSHEEIAERMATAGEALAASVAALPEPPDLVAVHDDRMAAAAARLVPLVVAGHFHEAAGAVHEGTIFLRVGSTGGGGIDAFVGAEPVRLSAQILYLEGDPPRLVAYDDVSIDPETRDLEVDRRLAPEPTLSPD